MLEERTLQQMINDLTWVDIVADGIVTTEGIEARLIAEGCDPRKYDYLYG